MEKQLRLDNSSLDEYVHTLKNEVNDLNFRLKEQAEEMRRLNQKISESIMDKAEAYANSTMSILNGGVRSKS